MRRMAIAIAGLVLLLSGCQSAPRPAAGLAALQVRVVAEPKAGAAPAAQGVKVYDAPSKKAYGAFEPVDYANLDQIVVWVERRPPDTTLQGLPSITVPLAPGKSAPNLRVACVTQTISFRNDAARAMNLYSVSDGNNFDLGSLAPGGVAAYKVRGPGLIEVLTDSIEQPIATIYAAPSRWVALAHAGETIDFQNLPPGEYRVVSWHPRLPGSQTTATLRANEVGTASIKVGVNSLPKDQWR
jgi:hypothetical protein